MGEIFTKNITSGQVIYSSGDESDAAYYLESGRVLISLGTGDTERPLKILDAGEVFGESALTHGRPRTVSCRALTDSRLIMITKAQLLSHFAGGDAITAFLPKFLQQILIQSERLHHEALLEKVNGATVSVEAMLKEKEEAAKRIALEMRIANGLDQDEFVPFYQPIYNLTTGEICGCEALLRWITKDKGIVSPAEFMDVLEDSPMILRAGKMVIEKAMTDLKSMRVAFGHASNFFVSVNVSGRQFMDTSFIEHLERTRELNNHSPAHVKLELTERVMIECLQAMSTLYQCQGFGYPLAIDDFGTGFSSLKYLANMPLADLKIDRSFVMNMSRDSRSLSIVKSLIGLASNLGLALTAEGIETREELACLQSLQIGMLGQGYLFSKAIPLTDFIKLPNKIDMHMSVAAPAATPGTAPAAAAIAVKTVRQAS